MVGFIGASDRELEDDPYYRIPEIDYITNFSKNIAAQILNNEKLKNDPLKILGLISLYLHETLRNE